jgi:hypothetical protein
LHLHGWASRKNNSIPFKGDRMKIIIKRLVLFALLLPALATQASDKSFGAYTIHYSAFSSDFLTPPIAKSYGIVRSKNRAILNVTITKKDKAGKHQPIEANITSKAFNVYQQAKPLSMRKIEEQDAIYYIAEFSVANEETINFRIDAQDNKTQIGSVSFQQQFFH